jgi:hypothetical protein
MAVIVITIAMMMMTDSSSSYLAVRQVLLYDTYNSKSGDDDKGKTIS